MKKSMTGIMTVVSILQLALPPSAWAGLNRNTDALGVDANKLPPSVSCNDICSMLIEGRSSVRGVEGTDGWDKDDDRWCANHGSPTEAGVVAQPNLAKRDTPCNVPMLAGDTECQEVNRKLLQCKFHNTQVETQCLAYRAAEQAKDFDYALAVIDTGVAASCGVACATKVGGDPLAIACQAGAIAAGTAEFVKTLTQQSGPIAKGIGAISSGIGLGYTAANLAGYGGDNAPGLGQMKGNERTSDQNDSCVVAVAFGVLAGLRIHNIVSINNTKDNACGNVRKFVSQAKVTDPDGPQPDITYASQSAGATSGGGSSGITGSGGATAGALSTPVDLAQISCIGNGTANASCPGQTGTGLQGSQATDANFLTRSGMDKSVAPLAAKLAAGPLSKAAIDQNGAGALGSALGSLGGLGSGLAQLASIAGDNAGSLAVPGMGSGIAYASSGGGGGSRGGAEASNPFGNLFGTPGGGLAAGGRAPSTESYGRALSNDIWHTGTSQNIFEIVSSKVSNVASRVGVK